MLRPEGSIGNLTGSSFGRRRAGKSRAQNKPRQGCRNCKLRSVKCDEFRPQCKRCTGYGVLCNYQQEYDELQVPLEGTAHIFSISDSLLGLSSWPDKNSKLLHMFRAQTAMTVSAGGRLLLYQNEVLRLVDDNSFLNHAVLTLTLMHERHLETPYYTTLSRSEAYHWYLATAEFNKDLSRATAIQSNIDKQVALWCTASLLGQVTFCHVEVQYPEDSWPLRDSPGTDLNWLKMSNGKHEVVKLAEKIYSHPQYRELLNIPPSDLEPIRYSELPFSIDILDQFNVPEYKDMADDVRKILSSKCLITIILTFWTSVHTTALTFISQLERKEPKALSLLLLWFTKLYQLPIWWLKRRTWLEGQALCMYLERFHGSSVELQPLLSWARDVLFSPSSMTYRSMSAMTGR